ncbi:MAG TPA: tetratricopeptide repeat protein [Anaeromyxobacter sp.]|nr:tetratricopeptide repeat protein [Anaeromyxobacter sp.]
MSSWVLWALLSWATGNPILALLMMAAAWWLGDRLTFRVLPDPLGLFRRWNRVRRLRTTLQVNSHDRRARFELAELLLEGGHPRKAAAVLRPNIEAGDEDARTAFVMGAALGRSGAYEQGERALELARAEDPRFRAGEIDLELGRQRLAGRDFERARRALERLLSERPGSIEGRYLLGRALAGLGDETGARAVREEAWREYKLLPRFQRRHERRFAWRIKPWRPALMAVAVLILLWLAARALG